jgi:hypothetical protein
MEVHYYQIEFVNSSSNKSNTKHQEQHKYLTSSFLATLQIAHG